MDSIEEFVLENQLDATIRVLGLLPNKSLTTNDIFNVLAQAETDAQFVCGFVSLNQADDEKKNIIEHAINRGLIAVDSEKHLILTPKGKETAKKELPEPIEKSIRNRQ